MKVGGDIYQVLVGSALLLGEAIVLFKDSKGKFYPVEILTTKEKIIFSLQGISGTAKGVISRLKKLKATTLVKISNHEADMKYGTFIMMIRNAKGYNGSIRLKKGKNRMKILHYSGGKFCVLNKSGTEYKKFSKVKDFAHWMSKNVSKFTFPSSFYAKTTKQRKEAFKMVRLAEANSIPITKTYGNVTTTSPIVKVQREMRENRSVSKPIEFSF